MGLSHHKEIIIIHLFMHLFIHEFNIAKNCAKQGRSTPETDTSNNPGSPCIWGDEMDYLG